MNQIKVGRFIASLRKEKNLTQEQLSEKLSVTSKTISRWENGNYMPDIEMLQELSQFFSVSVNELLSGERLEDNNFKKVAEENVINALKQSPFTISEHEKYYKEKWMKEHFFENLIMIVSITVLLFFINYFLIKNYAVTVIIYTFVLFSSSIYLRNRMMIYVEGKIYDGKTIYAKETNNKRNNSLYLGISIVYYASAIGWFFFFVKTIHTADKDDLILRAVVAFAFIACGTINLIKYKKDK